MNSNAKFNPHLVRAVRRATLQQQLQIKTIIQESTGWDSLHLPSHDYSTDRYRTLS